MSEQNSQFSAGKIAIVTGGSLGRNTVMSLAKRGVNSIFTYHRNRAEADAVVSAINEPGAQAIALQLDTGNIGLFDAWVNSVQSALTTLGAKRFDFLINNAGTSHREILPLLRSRPHHRQRPRARPNRRNRRSSGGLEHPSRRHRSRHTEP